MARFVNSELSTQHAGITRFTRGFDAIGKFNAVHAVLASLALIGAPVRQTLQRQAAARKQRREDQRLWEVALTDARVMADLSRAMSRDAARDVRGYC
jgi:hypothetical protein